MLEYVKEAIVTATQLPPPVDGQQFTIVEIISGISATFLLMLGGVFWYAYDTRKDISEQVAAAVEAAKKEMAGSILTNADRIATEVRSFNAAKDDLWRKIDEFIDHRVEDARNLPTKVDLEASRQDARKDREAMESRIQNSISELRSSLTNLIMRKQ